MVLKNTTENSLVAKNLKLLTSFSQKNSGLLDKKNGEEVVIKTRFGIHTFFLKNLIDVIILDKNNKVVRIFEDLKPFRVVFWNPLFDTVIELPKNSIKTSSTKVGHQLEIT